MNFSKTVIILKQTEKGFSRENKTLSGIARLESENGVTSIYLTLVNFFPADGGDFELFISSSEGGEWSFPISSHSSSFTLKPDGEKSGENYSIGLFFVKNSIPLLIAFGTDGKNAPSINQIKRDFSERILDKNKKGNFLEQSYDDEVVATENYYLNDKELKEKLRMLKDVDDEFSGNSHGSAFSQSEKEAEESKQEFDGFKNETDNDVGEKYSAENPYFKTVRKELEDIFNKFKKEEALERVIPESKWVKIFFSEEKYYVVGLVKEDNTLKYICYGVPSFFSENPPDALKGFCSFVPLSVIKPKGNGYWMMFQDAISGECVNLD